MPMGATYAKMASYSGKFAEADGIRKTFASSAVSRMTSKAVPRWRADVRCASHSHTTMLKHNTASTTTGSVSKLKEEVLSLWLADRYVPERDAQAEA